MSTGEDINSALEVIGRSGFDGLAVRGRDGGRALASLLKRHAHRPVSYSRLLTELKRQGLIEVVHEGKSFTITLTPAGAYRLQQHKINQLRIPTPKKWDKRWRWVAFDIPNAQSRQRNLLTKHLKLLGFEMIQKSLWAHPFPCFEQIEQLAGHYNVSRFCTLMLVSSLDSQSDARLNRRFADLLQ